MDDIEFVEHTYFQGFIVDSKMKEFEWVPNCGRGSLGRMFPEFGDATVRHAKSGYSVPT
jgi:hypothetical protein